jgi:hypothetical protein
MKVKQLGILMPALLLLLALASLSQAQVSGPPGVAAPQAALGNAASTPLSTSFTYQGQLKKGAQAVTGDCDMAFRLYDAEVGGSQLGSAITTTVPITNGLFTMPLNSGGEFGSTAFTGDARWLGIQVRCTGEAGFTDLGRQPITAAPYALHSVSTGALQGHPVTTTAPTPSQVFKWDGSAWTPAADDNTLYTAGDGLELVGAQFEAKGTPYQNVVIVAKSGGDFTSIQAALNSITGTADNRYLVWVAPGIYTETVTMKPYIDIEGAGELLTTISYSGSASLNSATLLGANDAELRFLSVQSTSEIIYAVAIRNWGVSPRLTHVTASASGGTHNYGVYNSSGSPRMTYVTAQAEGGVSNYGVYYYYATLPVMMNVTAFALDGEHNYGVYNFHASPIMANVTISATGGNSTNHGVYNDTASPQMTNVTVSASGGSGNNYGVRNRESSSPTMTNMTISAWGGSHSQGVHNELSSPMIQNSTIVASGASGNNYGVYNAYVPSGAYTVTINHSQITGSTRSISNNARFTTRVGASLLAGGDVGGGGTMACYACYDENYTNAGGINACP